MAMPDRLPDDDLFAVLEPAPEDAARLIGTIEGPPGWEEGFGAGLRCWCGPALGWRSLGDVILGGGAGTIVSHKGRLSIGISFDLGAGPSRPIRGGDDDDAADQHSRDDADQQEDQP
jgi:hypothetical protein